MVAGAVEAVETAPAVAGLAATVASLFAASALTIEGSDFLACSTHSAYLGF